MKIQTGALLTSTPELLLDHVFNQSVLLLTEHNDKGSMGFMLNKPLNITLQDVFEDIPLNIQLWDGGPVETTNMFYIHNVPHYIPFSVPIDEAKKIYISGDFNIVKKALIEGLIDERNIKFFLGYTGWAPKQLGEEIKEKAWFVTPNDLDIININPKNVWKEKIVAIDPENIIWKNAPANPLLN